MTITRGLRFDSLGEPAEVLSLVDLDLPAPGAGQVTVDLEAAPVDPADLNFVRGRYGLRPALPSGVGQSGVGRISAVGPELAAGAYGHRAGDRVLIIPTGEQFSWRNRVNVDVANVVAVDGDVDPVQLSAVGVNLITAYQLLDHGTLEKGDWVAQTAANSAVGGAVIALAHQRGLRTLNIVRRPEAVRLVDERADAVLVDDDNLAEGITAVLGEEKMRLLLAATGSAVPTAMQYLGYNGTVVAYAALDRQPIALPPLAFANLHVHGFWVLNWLRDTDRGEVHNAYRAVADLVAQGAVRTPVAATYSLEEFATALAHSAKTGTDGRQGKVFLTFAQS
ncbi:zinc-dependent alcohol dehydrogenase family protein [Amycolatopsis sp. NPDC005232]|uniref:zinc-dependent alcohol dehydrogenase family protein n=1 Tax=Amycolatopsis sp. NPDC005232 TaxID=3157027 RepID=UPI0033A4C821